MVAQQRPAGATKQAKRRLNAGWADLTWSDLESWAGSRSVSRGRSYQRGGRVKQLATTNDGGLLATVVGGEHYAVTVTRGAGKRATSLKSSCTCPVGHDGCKHAVATVAEYLEALAEGRDVPSAEDDDPRWEQIESCATGIDDEWDDDDESSGDEVEESEARSSASLRVSGRASRRSKTAVDWDAKIEGEIRAKSPEELADLVWSLVQRFPELHQEFRERIALREGDVTRLVAEARAEIHRITSEPAWQSRWTGKGQTPDYGRIRHQFERLLELGHADEVAALGLDLIEQGLRQVGQSDDDGATARELNKCLPIVFRAVDSSSLSRPERLLFAIDAHLADDYGIVEAASGVVLEAPYQTEDWSAVADALLARLKAMPVGDPDSAADFTRTYHRDRVTDWAARALQKAGREDELQAIYESEARATGSYQRLVKFLVEHDRFDDAQRWAQEGLAKVAPTYAGIKASLLGTLTEVAAKRRQWDAVAVLAAFEFFDRPSRLAFYELIKAAGKAKAEERVRAAALHFLETGVRPYQVTAPRPTGQVRTTARDAAGRRAASTGPTSTQREPEPTPRLTIDQSWPLPVPDYLIPLLAKRAGYAQEQCPHLDVLLDMAIAAKRPDEVLHWYEKMPTTYGYRGQYSARVAEAVVDAHPERALAIYRQALEAQLPHADQTAYQNAVDNLRKMCPIYETLNRKGEWSALIASIRASYRNRPRFMELLDGLEGRTIIQTARPRRK